MVMTFIMHGVGLASIAACVWLTIETGGLATEILPVIIMGLVWCLGFGFYFWEPIARHVQSPHGMGLPPHP